MGLNFDQKIVDCALQLQPTAGLFRLRTGDSGELRVETDLPSAKNCSSLGKIFACRLGEIAAGILSEGGKTGLFVSLFPPVNKNDIRSQTAFGVHGQTVQTPLAVVLTDFNRRTAFSVLAMYGFRISDQNRGGEGGFELPIQLLTV